MRIMKSRKTITHVELISEVIVATRSRGVLDPADIKKNIEKYVLVMSIFISVGRIVEADSLRLSRLIEKDYMERDETEDGRNAYSYLA